MSQDTAEGKKPWLSKTHWTAALIALVPLIPGVGPVAAAWIAANPELFSVAVGTIFSGLRTVTKERITIK